MKKKIVIATTVLSLAVAGVVSAASIWGTYKGNDIIRLTVGGDPVKVSDVPAISYNDRTMIPIYLLKQAGIDYTWDQKNKTVDIKENKQTNVINNFDPAKRTKEIIALGGSGVTLINFKNDLTSIVNFKQTTSFDNDWSAIFNILIKQVDFGATYSRVEYIDSSGTYLGTIEIITDDLKNYISGILNDDQLNKRWVLSGPIFQNNVSNSTSSNNSTEVNITYPGLYSNDGKVYLGKLTTNQFDTDSVFNEFGTYGSEFQTKSIWNQFGTYGSEFSSESAFNKLATKPPAIVLNGKIIGYVTVNTLITGGISPNSLYDWLKNKGY